MAQGRQLGVGVQGAHDADQVLARRLGVGGEPLTVGGRGSGEGALRRLRSRERRLATALLTGRTQAEAATAERITQSAVSQAVSRSGVRELLALDAELASLPSSLAAGEEAQ